MTQQYEAWAFSIDEMTEAEIIEYFQMYGFTDELGHDLTRCIPFLELVRAAKQVQAA